MSIQSGLAHHFLALATDHKYSMGANVSNGKSRQQSRKKKVDLELYFKTVKSLCSLHTRRDEKETIH